MNEPTKSLPQQLIHSVTDPFSLAILTGVASSSFFFFFGNLGLMLDGIIPATITESERARKGISDVSALKMWEWMYYRAKVRFPTAFPILTRTEHTVRFSFIPQKHFASAGLLSCISYLVASTFRTDLRHILYGASFFSFTPLLYTVAVCECWIIQYPTVLGSRTLKQ